MEILIVEFERTEESPQFTLAGKLWWIFCEYFRKKMTVLLLYRAKRYVHYGDVIVTTMAS